MGVQRMSMLLSEGAAKAKAQQAIMRLRDFISQRVVLSGVGCRAIVADIWALKSWAA